MTTIAPAQPTRRTFTQPVMLTTLAILLIGVAAYLLLSRANLGAWDFRNNLWAPAHLLVGGHSPYLIESLFPGSNAVWMPTVIGAFFPLGWLTESQATALWVVISAGAYLTLIILSSGKARPAPLTLGICVGLMLIFPPFVSALRLGQYGMIAALLLLLAARLTFQSASPIWIGLLVALASAKPQLILLPVMGLLWYTWRTTRHGARGTDAAGKPAVVAAAHAAALARRTRLA